jgi:hypothetical protein
VFCETIPLYFIFEIERKVKACPDASWSDGGSQTRMIYIEALIQE